MSVEEQIQRFLKKSGIFEPEHLKALFLFKGDVAAAHSAATNQPAAASVSIEFNDPEAQVESSLALISLFDCVS